MSAGLGAGFLLSKMANNTPEKNTMSRREFLRKAGLVAAGVAVSTLTGCQSGGGRPEALASSPTRTPDSGITTVPTATVTPEPTRDLDGEREARWSGKFWEVGITSQDAGGLEMSDYREEMSAFRNELTQMAEENGFNSDTVEMVLVGNNAEMSEEDGVIEPVEFYGLMIARDRILCFTKNDMGMNMNEDCGWFEKSQEVWGDNWSYRVVSSDQEVRSSFLMREQDGEMKIFRPSHDQFGVLTIEEGFVDGEMTEDEDGGWRLDGEVKAIEGGKKMTGVLVIGENGERIGNFLLECKTLELARDFREGIFPRSADLVNGWIPVDMFVETEGEFRAVGYLDLKDGTWHGEEGYEEIESILEPDVLGLAEKVGAMQLEGFTFSWNEAEGRMEYIDEKGKSVAYWSSEGRIELMPGVVELDFQVHRGLFVEEDSQVVAQRYQETGKMPLPFSADSGVVGETNYGLKILYVSNIVDNSPIVAFSSGNLERVRVDSGTKENDAVIFTTTGGGFYLFICKMGGDRALPESVVAGNTMFLATNPDFSELPIPQQRDSMFGISKGDFGEEEDLGLRELMTDNFGRIVMARR